MNRLQTAPGQYRIVVIDGAIPGSGATARQIKVSWPEKHVIVLTGPRQPAMLAQSLLLVL
ncbi:MAG TPA: hypothetical protein VE959_30815 [Bryobacteraceae bacterium]|nr:hypothetical protein [Bryobacteraceae bacterium]